MKELPKNYSHKEAEKKWQKTWEENRVYAWDELQPRKNTFVIDTPPPTVSGVLHMGHIFSYTQADFVARYQRMSGKTVFYPMGYDDNGLPTERLVEKVKKLRAHNMSREEFIKQCEEVSAEARAEFHRLFESVALSVDWKQEYHTISDESRKISQLSFLDLYNKKHAYRKLQPMLWDPVDQTAIAQAEVVDKELDSFENYITFGLDDGSGKRVGEFRIMTTRPELIPACVAIMCDPKQYKKYKGMQAIRPISGIRVPIIADEKVDSEKGTGMVMCCTFGDETDIYWYDTYKEKYNLPLRVVLNRYGKFDGRLMDRALGDNQNKGKIIALLDGVPVKKAREEIFIKALEADGSLVERKPIKHTVKCAERSGAALELLPTEQWFIKVLDKKKQLKKKANECEWYPDFMRIRMEQWIDGLNWDWCISRQRFFGVPFPVWYSKKEGEEGKIIIADSDQLPVNPLTDLPKGYTKDEVVPEKDVMDTWATSSVSPQLSSKAITKDLAIDYERHKKLFPADLRPQAHEIIRTWAFYTIVKAMLHEGEIPWKNLMISGWCLAPDKTKMSKSKGNVITPVDLIEEQGADVVRYWSSTSRLGADTAFSEDVLKIGKKLVNKIWNATKFGAIHLSKLKEEPKGANEDVKSGVICETLDKWILARLNRTIEKATAEFEKFEYSNARAAVEDFFWNDFCDNYLEMIKGRAYNEEGSNDSGQRSAVHAIYYCLEAVLKLFAPITPHITEELYSHIFDNEHQKIGSIHRPGTWPDAKDYPVDEKAERTGIAACAILDVVRRMKADKNVSLKWPLDKLIISGDAAIEETFYDLAKVTNAKSIEMQGKIKGEAEQTEDGQFKIAAEFAKESDAA